MIELHGLTFTHDGAAEPVLRDVDLTIAEGELALVAGRTGSGKSTLLGTINGLTPHFTGGMLAGDVRVDGASIRAAADRVLADASIDVEYLELRDAETLQPVDAVERDALLLVAARVGAARLIDNHLLRGVAS